MNDPKNPLEDENQIDDDEFISELSDEEMDSIAGGAGRCAKEPPDLTCGTPNDDTLKRDGN